MNIEKYKNSFIVSDEKKYYLINMRNRKYISFKKEDNLSKEYLLEKLLKSEEMLIYNEIIEENLEKEEYNNEDYPYKPILGTFLVSSICNLKCSYCYAQNNENTLLSYENSKKAVDFLIRNALEKGCKDIILKFHGIGEPTLNFNVIVNTYNYAKEVAKKNNLNLKAGITTNGVFDDEKRLWINENLDNITISFDGFKDIQNYQRKSLTLDSYNEGIKTIQAINKEKITIRTTVTKLNVKDIINWTKYLSSLGIKRVNYEPVIICGRAKEEKLENVNEDEFVNNYLKAKEIGEELGIEVTYSGIKENKNTLYHCGAYGRNFVIAPNGLISTCYEVTKRSNDNLDYFIIGDTTLDSVKIDRKKVHNLRKFANNKRLECSGCFSEYHCSGGCLSKRAIIDEVVNESNKIKCNITCEILFDEVLKRVSKEDRLSLQLL